MSIPSLFAYPLFASTLLIMSLMVLTWIVSIITRNAGFVDVMWGMTIFFVALLAFFLGDGAFERKATLLFLVLIWGGRLSFYLFMRAISSNEDKRYYNLRVKWGEQADLKFLVLFLFQGFLILVLTLPFFSVCFNVTPRFSWMEYLGVGVSLLGILGESIADFQLNRFKSKPENRGKVLDKGLWGLSRHPNYFFEWVVWVGLALFCFPSPMGYTALFSAVLMLYLLMFLSGVPLSEKGLEETRGEAYLRYKKEVSPFFPWFRRF